MYEKIPWMRRSKRECVPETKRAGLGCAHHERVGVQMEHGNTSRSEWHRRCSIFRDMEMLSSLLKEYKVVWNFQKGSLIEWIFNILRGLYFLASFVVQGKWYFSRVPFFTKTIRHRLRYIRALRISKDECTIICSGAQDSIDHVSLENIRILPLEYQKFTLRFIGAGVVSFFYVIRSRVYRIEHVNSNLVVSTFLFNVSWGFATRRSQEHR